MIGEAETVMKEEASGRDVCTGAADPDILDGPEQGVGEWTGPRVKPETTTVVDAPAEPADDTRLGGKPKTIPGVMHRENQNQGYGWTGTGGRHCCTSA